MKEEEEEEVEKERSFKGEEREGAEVPQKENKCVGERKKGATALSISLSLAYRRSQGTLLRHLNFGEDTPPAPP